MVQVLEQDANTAVNDGEPKRSNKRRRSDEASDVVEVSPPVVDSVEAEPELHTHEDAAEHATEDEDARASTPADDPSISLKIEALLLASDRPLSESRLAELTGLIGRGIGKRITRALEQLNGLYEKTGRSFRARRLAGGWQLMTQPEYGDLLAALHEVRQQSKLTPAGIETLSIIAYRQPIMRAEVESIRGVAAGDVLRGLMERRLVKIVGRAEVLGRPMLYGTTSEFLKTFGLASLEDLPEIGGLSIGKTKPVSTPSVTAETKEVPLSPLEDAPPADVDEDA